MSEVEQANAALAAWSTWALSVLLLVVLVATVVAGYRHLSRRAHGHGDVVEPSATTGVPGHTLERVR